MTIDHAPATAPLTDFVAESVALNVEWAALLGGAAISSARLTASAVHLRWYGGHNVYRIEGECPNDLQSFQSDATLRTLFASHPGNGATVFDVTPESDSSLFCFACVSHYASMRFSFQKKEGPSVAVVGATRVSDTQTELELRFNATDTASQSYNLIFRNAFLQTSASPLLVRVYEDEELRCADDDDDDTRGLFVNYMFADSDLEHDLIAQIAQLRELATTTALLFVDRRNSSAGADVVIDGLVDCDRNAYPGTPRGAMILQAFNGAVKVVRRMREPNMDDPNQLRDFLTTAIRTYRRAAWVALGLSAHGNSFNLFGGDETPENTATPRVRSYIAAIRDALRSAGMDRLSAIGFDACTMAHIGVIDQLVEPSPLADYVLASEDLIPANGWQYHGARGATNALMFMEQIAATSYATFSNLVRLSYSIIDLREYRSAHNHLKALFNLLRALITAGAEKAQLIHDVTTALAATPAWGTDSAAFFSGDRPDSDRLYVSLLPFLASLRAPASSACRARLSAEIAAVEASLQASVVSVHGGAGGVHAGVGLYLPGAAQFSSFADVFYGARRIHDGARVDYRVDFLTSFYHSSLYGGCDVTNDNKPPFQLPYADGYYLCLAIADVGVCSPNQGKCDGGGSISQSLCNEYCFASQNPVLFSDFYAYSASANAGLCDVENLWIDARRLCPVACRFCSSDSNMQCDYAAPPASPAAETHGWQRSPLPPWPPPWPPSTPPSRR